MKIDLSSELIFSASRSSGAGGQNVNKVNTKVELRFHVASSAILSDNQKNTILDRLANRISDSGDLILVAQTERSQLKNKEAVIEKFNLLIEKALTPRKKRRPTRPTLASKEHRLESKQKNSEKKIRRKDFLM